jgi:MraZ protein
MDGKGRTSVSAPIRDELVRAGVAKLVITTDVVRGRYCLVVYPEPVWDKFLEWFETLPDMDPDVEVVRDTHIAPAQPLVMDGQGRILIPQSLREEAKLGSKVVVVAAGDKFRIWDADIWAQDREDAKARYADSKKALAARPTRPS